MNSAREMTAMKTKAVRLYGRNDLKLEEFELPPIKDDEILAHVISDGICMSTYKEVMLGEEHKRVPADISKNPIIIGHEFCGEILEVGRKWKHRFEQGQRFAIQPNIKYQNKLQAPGYSYPYIGGAATHIILPHEVMDMDCLLDFKGEAFFYGSLAEPISCIIAAFAASFHIEENYMHKMGIKPGGNLAILGGGGPMGLGAIDLALHAEPKPGLLLVTDIDQNRLERAASIFTAAEAKAKGVELHFFNSRHHAEAGAHLMELSKGIGYHDVFVFAPIRELVELGDAILARDGCFNFFAGPENPGFRAEINFYDIHYLSHHFIGTSGGNRSDMVEALGLVERQVIDPSFMITHIGGLNAVADTTRRLPDIGGGKKMIYTNIDLELTALDDLERKAKENILFASLADCVGESGGRWTAKAEKILLENARKI
jgi:threonine dehydrogenase-like Zn-dependent dehydrogenase